MTDDSCQNVSSAEYADTIHPRFTPEELLVLQRAMAGIFLDWDADLRPVILRKLVRAEIALREAQ